MHMRNHQPLAWTLTTALALAAGSPPAALRAAPADAPAPPAAADTGAIKWQDVFRFRLSDGQLVLESGPTPEVLRRAGAENPSGRSLEVEGLPGNSTLTLTQRCVIFRNTAPATGDGRRATAMVYITPARIDFQATVSGRKSVRVSLYQAGAGGMRNMRPGDVRLNVSGDDVENHSVSLVAPDFGTLRHQHPNEVNRYVRPMLRQLGLDLMDLEPSVVRQVLGPGAGDAAPGRAAATRPATGPADGPAPDPKLQAEVDGLVADLDAPAFARRDAAATRLAGLGDPALDALRRLDRGRLTPEQNLAIDVLLPERRGSRLTPEDVPPPPRRPPLPARLPLQRRRPPPRRGDQAARPGDRPRPAPGPRPVRPVGRLGQEGRGDRGPAGRTGPAGDEVRAAHPDMRRTNHSPATSDGEPPSFPLPVGLGTRAEFLAFSVDQYHRMIRDGVLLEGSPFELLNGLIVRKDRGSPGTSSRTFTPQQAFVINGLAGLDRQLRRRGCHMRTQQPISLPPYDEPEPDGSIVSGGINTYRERHPRPSDVSCVIEVADGSVELDRGLKLRIYAGAGIAHYFIVNLPDRVIESYTEPIPGTGRYGRSVTSGAEESVGLPAGRGKPLAVPVRNLLP